MLNVLNGFNQQMPHFQVSNVYTKRAVVKNGSTYPILTELLDTSRRKRNLGLLLTAITDHLCQCSNSKEEKTHLSF